ncbi:hypothetical protein WA538_002599, partial [Blastocystis sp. DL]
MEEYKKTHPSNKRDPDLPKKPLTAYMLFNQAKRAEIKSAHPDYSITEISKEIGKMWKDVSEKEKEDLEEQYKKAKEQYDEEMKKYYEKHPEKLNEKKEKAPKKEKARSKKAVKNEEVEEKSETESEKESENLFD